MKKGRWFIPIAIAVGAIAGVAYGPIFILQYLTANHLGFHAKKALLGDSIDYALTYLSCGVDNLITPFKGECGDCVIDTMSGRISIATIEFCGGDPLIEGGPAVIEVEPKSSFDIWLLENTNSNNFAVTCPGPLCGKNLQPEWSIERSKTREPQDFETEVWDD